MELEISRPWIRPRTGPVVPEWFGNRNAPARDPAALHSRYVSKRIFRCYIPKFQAPRFRHSFQSLCNPWLIGAKSCEFAFELEFGGVETWPGLLSVLSSLDSKLIVLDVFRYQDNLSLRLRVLTLVAWKFRRFVDLHIQ